MKYLESQLTLFLESIGSSPIKRIWRIVFEHRGEIGDEGPIELEFEDHTWLFDNESDGETLRISDHRWTDRFGTELTLENERFVAECGKWSRVDVSGLEPYKWWVGEPVSKALLLTNEFGTPAGVAISTRSSTFWFVVRGDECHLLFEKPGDFDVVL